MRTALPNSPPSGVSSTMSTSTAPVPTTRAVTSSVRFWPGASVTGATSAASKRTAGVPVRRTPTRAGRSRSLATVTGMTPESPGSVTGARESTRTCAIWVSICLLTTATSSRPPARSSRHAADSARVSADSSPPVPAVPPAGTSGATERSPASEARVRAIDCR